MSDWDFTGDQYHIDTESRYPLFSDIQTNDDSIAIISQKPPPRTRKHEEKFRVRRPNLHAYCNCDKCLHERWLHSRINQPQTNVFEQINADNIILIIFMFLVIVFICCFYTKAIFELKAQVKSLEILIKKEQLTI